MTPADTELMERAFATLQAVVAIDSQSDEASRTIPSTEGQRVLAAHVSRHLEAAGFQVETDAFANVIASRPGAGAGVDAPPVAFMVHLDTARGTGHPPALHRLPAWDGAAVPYPGNPDLRVDTANYPELKAFVRHTVVHGDGRVPFGLDDKLGLTHLLTLADRIAAGAVPDHPPLLLIGRPDEEIGRMEAVDGLAALLATRGVRSGYTVDGILPFEVNTQNFNAAHATITFPETRLPTGPDLAAVALHLGGVNTHGATAHAEGHRAALRLATEILDALTAAGVDAHPHAFESDALRDCDGTLTLLVAPGARDAVEAAARAVVGPHLPRGASLRIADAEAPKETGSATAAMLSATAAFLRSAPGAPLLAEDSAGWEGYSHPYRARADGHDVKLDVRIRDFDPASLERRKSHVQSFFTGLPGVAGVSLHDQYVNMGPRLADRRDLVDAAIRAGAGIGVAVRELPIRGGTGVDPFLDRGTAVANLGTGYFAPESEKELTSLELMAGHVRWLEALCGVLAAHRAP